MARPRTKSDHDVLAATLRAVSEHGVARLTLADVAREAGLAPSTLAERFGSKRALLLAAARSGLGGVERAAAAAGASRSPQSAKASGAAPPRAAAIDFLVALAAPVADRRAFAHHLALLELDIADPEFRAAAADYVAAVLARLRAFGLSAAAARALYVAYNGALVLWALTGEGSLEASLRADLESSSPEPGGARTSPSA